MNPDKSQLPRSTRFRWTKNIAFLLAGVLGATILYSTVSAHDRNRSNAHCSHRGSHMMGMGRGLIIGDLFDEVDTDRDNTVSRSEMHSFVSREIAAVDGDNNTKLSRDELGALILRRLRPMIRQIHARLDDNEDSLIDAEEVKDRIDWMFDRMNTNNNDKIEADEIHGSYHKRK